MHHQRHTVYWKLYSPDEFVYRTRSLTDEVKIGDEKDEGKHALQGENDSIYGMIIFGQRILGSVWQRRMVSYTLHINKRNKALSSDLSFLGRRA